MEMYLQKNYLDEASIKKDTIRDGAGIGIRDAGELHDDVVVLGADTSGSSKAQYFAEAFPDRFIQCGVAEQNMIGVAAGMAYYGKTAYAVTYAAFLVGRPWEPIRTTICYPNNKVILVGSHAGLATGEDGPTHQMTEDISIMRCLPNMTVIAPCDFEEARKATRLSYDVAGPVYIRACREKTPVFTTEKTPFEIGKAQVMREGNDVTLIGHGYMTYRLLQVAELLKDTVSCEVINMHTIEPFDTDTIVASAKKTGIVFTAEDHNVSGGMGSRVAEALSEHYPVPVWRHGLYNQFAESGNISDLWSKYELDTQGVQKVLQDFLKKNGT